MVRVLAGAFGTALLAVMLVDAVQTVVVARRAQGLPRLARLLLHLARRPLTIAARQTKSPTRRENFLSVYGPLSLLADSSARTRHQPLRAALRARSGSGG